MLRLFVISLSLLALPHVVSAKTSPPLPLGVKVRDLAHVEGVRDNPLVGYGIVVGLAGTGDSERSTATLQSIANTLARFGVRVDSDQVASRNVATAILTATLPPFVSNGDKLDVNVASMGDATSLTGGTLMLAPLRGPDNKIYALAQGPLSVGGYRYDAFGNMVAKNHPTDGQIPSGAIVEANPTTSVVSQSGTIFVVLDSPNYVTASRVAAALSKDLPPYPDSRIQRVRAVDAGRVAVRLTPQDQSQLVNVLARIEDTSVVPDQEARVVVNERTGTVVTGGDVRMGEVSVAQGDLKVDITTDSDGWAPLGVGRLGDDHRGNARAGLDRRLLGYPQTDINVDESGSAAVSMPAGTNVSDLVSALNRLKVSPRDVISILQAIQRAGSLHAKLIIQ